jgi:hypothetical protein
MNLYLFTRNHRCDVVIVVADSYEEALKLLKSRVLQVKLYKFSGTMIAKSITFIM